MKKYEEKKYLFQFFCEKYLFSSRYLLILNKITKTNKITNYITKFQKYIQNEYILNIVFNL